MIHEICMVKSAKGRKVDCYFTSGHVRRFDMALIEAGLWPRLSTASQS